MRIVAGITDPTILCRILAHRARGTPEWTPCEPARRLGEAKEMPIHYGSAAVQEKDGKVVGVFITLDACRLPAELLDDEDEDD